MPLQSVISGQIVAGMTSPTGAGGGPSPLPLYCNNTAIYCNNTAIYCNATTYTP